MAFKDRNESKYKTNNTVKKAEPANTQDTYEALSKLPLYMIDWVEKNNHDIVTVWDESGKVIYISSSIEQLLGYHTSELRGTYWYEKISAEDVSYIRERLERASDSFQKINVNILNNSGKYIWSECNVAKLTDESSNRKYYISTLKDITDKKEAEEMMIRSEKMSVAGQLAAGIAHEIRNPLTSLKGFLQLLQAGVNGKEEYYQIMTEEIEKIETITSELLFISKPLTDNRKIESIDDMIHDVTVLLGPQAKIKNIDIKIISSGQARINCDRSQIKQVLINLLKNAIEAMDTPGLITFLVEDNEKFVKVSIVDEGPGIPEEIIHKLGEPFFTTKQTGTGLGIMITRQILASHQAKLEISQNENGGSTFFIVFHK
ncbi:ATP-binding protein [Oceanobacillus manasiensis]|uniref:ATP-binding protein n=1 Tax=Oceanobacillus manasiensis TaxID=586413 RepID=UPI0005A6C68D|nr:ATP-binding protein [Oceanobacillus manasiensis]